MTAIDPLRLGVVGLGRAFMLMLPTLISDRRVKLVAACDPRGPARDRFTAEFAAPAYETIGELLNDGTVEAVYIASPHQYHRAQAVAAARAGKAVLVEKPMALTIDDGLAMIAAADQAGTILMVGHSHSFDAPFKRTHDLIASGAFGPIRMITALTFTDFMYRPRRPEELDPVLGGGVVHAQGAHQVDIARLLGGGLVTSVRATTGSWDAARPSAGAYQASLTFHNGATASLTYSGYAHFDTDEFNDWINEVGQRRDPDRYGTARAALRQSGADGESALKIARTYGATTTEGMTAPAGHHQFGLWIASCTEADLRPRPDGVMIYGNDQRYLDPLPPPPIARAEVIDELYAALRHGQPPAHDGRWGLATLEVCQAILQSAADCCEVTLRHQTKPGNQR